MKKINMDAFHKIAMRRCLDLSKHRRFLVNPNPSVGCVIVHDNKIIAEGFTQPPGGNHAEIQALNQVTDPAILPYSTLYVSLEPCNHFGRTPPCSRAIVESGIKRVVIATKDPFPEVNGGGIATLKKAGIEVTYGVLEEEALYVNRRFFTFYSKKRPYIVLKWAETQNGYMATKSGQQKWISGKLAKQYVHKLRFEEDSIMVGKNTVVSDDPQLNIRLWGDENQPIRIVWDSQNILQSPLNIFDGTQPTWILNERKDAVLDNLRYLKLGKEDKLEQLFTRLYEQGIQSILVEGGSQTLNHFIKKGYWDEAHRIIGAVNWENGVAAPTVDGVLKKSTPLGCDIVELWQP